MTTASSIFAAILAHPERDDLRREYPGAIRGESPELASYIERGMRFPDVYDHSFKHPNPLIEEIFAPFRRFSDTIEGVLRRGFVETLYVEPDVFIRHGDELMSLAPILEVSFFIEHPRAESDRWWRDFLPALTQCPALARVRQLEFRVAGLDYVAMQQLALSPYLDSLISMSPRWRNSWHANAPWEADNEPDEIKMWELLLASPVFRRLTDWGLRNQDCDRPIGWAGANSTRLITRRQLGDRKWGQPVGTSGFRWWYEPMNDESRALEQTYGYIPALHATNWNASVLDVLRGTKPDFPAGTPPTDAMYVVPPDEHQVDMGY